jgi:hypothetical protein
MKPTNNAATARKSPPRKTQEAATIPQCASGNPSKQKTTTDQKSQGTKGTDPARQFAYVLIGVLALAITARLLTPAESVAEFDSRVWVWNLKGAGQIAAYVTVFVLLLFGVRLLFKMIRQAEHDRDSGDSQKGGRQ